jgi:DNA-binding NtrC family response regulator
MSTISVCLVEDDPIMGESLADRFGLEGFSVQWHQTGESAFQAITQNDFAAVISDIRLPDLAGEALFSRVIERAPRVPPFVFITGFASLERAVALLKQGAADYITKPFEVSQLIERVRALAGSGAQRASAEAPGVLGVSGAMRALEDMLPRVAARASSILITGESGVGKEVIARRIHALARPRMAGPAPFVPVNCGALPDTLLETEFFGHEKGSFTGAERAKRGYFEQANGGTLFLDEIGDLPLSMQVKLLRAIQERRIKRLGAEREVAATFQLICATNRNLEDLTRNGAFREDLYYRINVLPLHVPPLRERPDDVLWLAVRIIADICNQLREPAKTLHPTAEARLVRHEWPGNIRELKNRLERACIVSERAVLMPRDIFESPPGDAHDGDVPPTTLDAYMSESERVYLKLALERHGGRIGDTALALGISRKNLWEKMRRYGLRSAEPRRQ